MLAYHPPRTPPRTERAMVERKQIIDTLAAALEPLDWVRAAWLGGSDASGRTDEWSDVDLDLTRDPWSRVRLTSDSCQTPKSLGIGPDTRCLAIAVRGVPLMRFEMYELLRVASEASVTRSRIPRGR